jgi:hypothetical protein
MNICPEVPAFQVDTGPLLVPDFTSAQTNTIDRLELAHVAYNRLDWAEFILRRATAITAGRKSARYSIFRKSVTTRRTARS